MTSVSLACNRSASGSSTVNLLVGACYWNDDVLLQRRNVTGSICEVIEEAVPERWKHSCLRSKQIPQQLASSLVEREMLAQPHRSVHDSREQK